jgi:glycosyltransferase involved in cell wall biosynthesis
MMTAELRQGDAIGNYILALVRALRGWGAEVQLYSDLPNLSYPLEHRPSAQYRPTGHDILWLHYSIYTENIHWLGHTSDLRILDSQNVCPARLFHGYDPKMEQLCARGEAALSSLAPYTDIAVAHTDYVREDLLRRGFRRIHKLPMIVDTARFTGAGDPAWEPLLGQLDYLLFVGRVVPQKNLIQTVDVFAELRRRRPGLRYLLVGGRQLPSYSAEIAARAAALGVADDLVFVGPVTEAATLTSFLRNARFYLCLSEWESFCVPLAESLYFGTPVLGWDVPPIPETMGPGGVILRGGPAEMAAQADLLWDDRPRYERLRRDGRAHAARFTDANLRAALLDLLRDLAERG